MPFNVVVEKVRGFVADHHASVDSITEKYLALKIEAHQTGGARRVTDRPVPFVIEMRFEEPSPQDKNRGQGKMTRTIIHVSIRPQRHRDRRRSDGLQRAQQLAASLKSYLVAQDYHPNAQPSTDSAPADITEPEKTPAQ
jgi:hypothetical protein